LASSYISSLDLAITSYPKELLGKSGAVAAFLEHNKPVISVGTLRNRVHAVCNEKTNKDFLLVDKSSASTTAEDLIQLFEQNAAS
jgi:hypothetical protein